MNETDLEYFNTVVQTYYRTNNSIRDTAKIMDISRTKVRKILITMGVIESEITDKALPLIQKGMSLKEVSEKLNISVATLSTYLPYGNRVNNRENRTNDAIRSKQYKERQKNAASKQVRKTETRKESTATKNTTPEKVYHLHLGLKGTKYNSTLFLYGRTYESISRDILVPENYSLHALHYAIQKMFGWQNSHLHHFRFSEDLMDKLINNSYETYSRLCGIYFRFPYDDDKLDDIYWDDDYREGRSFKTWLKTKYSCFNNYLGSYEHYGACQIAADEFYETHPVLRIGATFEEHCAGIKKDEIVKINEASFKDFEYYRYNSRELLERLTVEEIFTYLPADLNLVYKDMNERRKLYENNILNDTDRKALPLTKEIEYRYDYGDEWKISITLDGIFNYHNQTLPICENADGLPVFDDVGGVNGYIDFLKCIKEDIPSDLYKDKEEALNLARKLGWTGRMSRPEKLL